MFWKRERGMDLKKHGKRNKLDSFNLQPPSAEVCDQGLHIDTLILPVNLQRRNTDIKCKYVYKKNGEPSKPYTDGIADI